MDPAKTPTAATSYKTLQLKPGAARELVEEAYWALVSELKLGHVPEPAFSQRTAELNAAYERVNSLPAHPAPPPKPLRRRRRLYLGGTRDVAPVGNYYDLLQVDEEAIDLVVRVAARHLMSRHSGASPRGRALREAAMLACEVLSDPVKRAEYDARIGIRADGRSERGQSETEGVVMPATAVTLEMDRQVSQLEVIATPIIGQEQDQAATAASAALTEACAGNEAPDRSEEIGQEVTARGQAEPVRWPTHDAHLDSDESLTEKASPTLADNHDGVPAGIGSELAPQDELALPTPQRDEVPTSARTALVGVDDGPAVAAAQSESPPLQPVDDAVHAPRVHQPHLGEYWSRLTGAGRRSRATASREAEAERLLSLREVSLSASEAGAVATEPYPVEPTSDVDCPGGIARVVFDTGPMAGTILPIAVAEDEVEGVEVSMAGADGVLTELRIVRRGDSYVLVHLDGPIASVCGQDMLLPVLVLEDGDTISVGASAAHFVAAHVP